MKFSYSALADFFVFHFTAASEYAKSRLYMKFSVCFYYKNNHKSFWLHNFPRLRSLFIYKSSFKLIFIREFTAKSAFNSRQKS